VVHRTTAHKLRPPLRLMDMTLKRFGINLRRTCSISNRNGTSATLTGTAVADTVSAVPSIKLLLTYLLTNSWGMVDTETNTTNCEKWETFGR